MAELTISEAAAALGVSVDTIRRKIKRGEMHAQQDSRGKYLVSVEGPVAGAASAGPASGPADSARLRLELEQAERMIEELRHQRQVLESELQGTRLAMQDAATERSELRRLLGNAQMLQMGRALPAPAESQPAAVTAPAQKPRRWWWPFGGG
ncbi:MAG: excisionase family DNA-binding protein [Dehalococcoidia bacterium]|nr:excisionase family DNA-binding protein [Dehalococcoidia bacterium]